MKKKKKKLYEVRKSYKFASQADQALAIGRFEAARQIYGKLAL
jgi:hypothetical protein